MSEQPEVAKTYTTVPVKADMLFQAVGTPKPGYTSTARLSFIDGVPNTLEARIRLGSGNAATLNVPLHELDSLVAVLKAAQEELAEGRHD